MKITVIGCGRWGSFIGWYLDNLGHNVTIYGLSDAPSFITLKETRKNEYLTLPESIRMTSDITESLDKDVIIISINSQSLRSVCCELKEINLQAKIERIVIKNIIGQCANCFVSWVLFLFSWVSHYYGKKLHYGFSFLVLV